MPSVFRNPSEDSSGSSDRGSNVEASHDEPSIDFENNRHESPLEAAHALNASPPRGSSTLVRLGDYAVPDLSPQQHSTLLGLALIEGRCRIQAANYINRDRHTLDQLSENDPEVIELARHLFAEISKELHKTGLLPDEFAGQNLERARMQYLNSFDGILDNIAIRHARENSEMNTLRSIDTSHLLSFNSNNNNNNNLSSFNSKDAIALQRPNMAAPRLPPQLVTVSFKEGAVFVDSTKSAYSSQFQERGMLGRGGFGVVYKAYVCFFLYLHMEDPLAACHLLRHVLADYHILY